ncbi:type II secretion system protein [Frigoriglobus tundricola]|uniref:Prepilin-type N-terminal cleavage/methylation domain-containing protein n=1 Tax=Frigoriglobus tundricola TaxID=2774151 RepID=A0A6M5YTT1_9BACT|nr:prepilin-type N-terminal cleavage/methylation domain-containing protein [Frigoriglobus tundricola]QJW97475.1 hypothetical protein FTUN_5049 [Frigoriglobus tundricola]
MTRRSRTERAGFSLIEMMVVITIIAVIMGLLLAAVSKAKEAGYRADTVARITAINTAIGTFKSQTSAKYIPAGQIDIDPNSKTYLQVIGPFRLMSQYPPVTTSNPNDLNVNCYEAAYIATLFTNSNPSNFGGSISTTLDANQTLLFFLNGIQMPDGKGGTVFIGFSSNPQYPFNPLASGGVENRKGPYLELTPNRYLVDSSPTAFARLIDGWGNPFAYFSSYNGRANLYGQGASAGNNPNWHYTNKAGQAAGMPAPYQANAAATPTAFVNPSGWQIISPGKDGVFGATGNWSNVDNNGQDDLSNFTDSYVGNGPN